MMDIKHFLVCLFFVGNYNLSIGQIISTPLTENLQIKQYLQQQLPPATQRDIQNIDLPFFDDFSYDGPFPITSHWEDQFVFINNNWANQPVSVGVATFDGLDETGSPYGGDSFGSSDTLTSVGLNLGGLSSAHISYYVQPKGLGDKPEAGSDLILEFRTSSGEWIEIERHQSLEPISIDSVLSFTFVGPIPIEESRYLYDGFQFRFRNFSTRSGSVDLWHIDYVRVDDQPTLPSIQDLAFTELPPSIFKNYSSAPWTHYISPESNLAEEESRQDFRVELYNHAIQNIQIEEGELATFNVTNGANNELFALDDLLATSTSVQPNKQEVDYVIPFNLSTLIAPLQSIPFISDNNLVFIKTEYRMTPSPQANLPEVLRNDKVSSITELSDYYAYDDGSGESGIQIQQLRGQAAVEFVNFKQDSLRGFQIQIPRIAASNGNITLKVWLEDLNTLPIVELPISPFFLDEVRDTFQAFITYALRDPFTGGANPVEIPQGTFFVGWEQNTCQGGGCVVVGLDRNTPEANQRTFLNEDGNWRNIAEFQELYRELNGAIMIRPILGDETPIDSELATSTAELLVSELLHIYPNPATDQVTIQLADGEYDQYQLQVYNALGQVMTNSTLTPQFSVAEFPAGVYYLRFMDRETEAAGFYRLVVE